MSIQQEIKNETVLAMKARDKVKTDTLKGLSSAFTNELVAKGKKPNEELADSDAMDVIKRAVKQRKDSIEQFKNGGREELAEKEEQELNILQEYLPEQMPETEIEKIVDQKIEQLGVADKAGMGKLMGAVMAEIGDRADGGVVKSIIDKKLS